MEIHRKVTRPGRDGRPTEKYRQSQEGMFDTLRKANKARKGCSTHLERQTRPGRDVRHT